MLNYKYLLLDADGTFFDFDATERIALKSVFENYKIPYENNNIDIYHIGNRKCWQDFEKGLISLKELKKLRFTLFFESLSLNYDAKEASIMYNDELAKYGILYNGAKETLEKLARDYTLIMITNGISEIQWGRINSSGVKEYFSQFVISEEINKQKPDVEFFNYTINLLECKKEECLIIGDSLSADIKGGLDSDIDTFYLHLDKKYKGEECLFHASSYSEMLSIIYAD